MSPAHSQWPYVNVLLHVNVNVPEEQESLRLRKAYPGPGAVLAMP